MFRENLKDLIEYNNLTIKELSAKTGISKRTLDTYVDGRAVIPNAEIAVRLAQALDTSVEYLVTGRESCSSTEYPPAEELAKFRKYKKIISDLDKISPELLSAVSAMIRTASHISEKETQKK